MHCIIREYDISVEIRKSRKLGNREVSEGYFSHTREGNGFKFKTSDVKLVSTDNYFTFVLWFSN